jgi:hypothetical protein
VGIPIWIDARARVAHEGALIIDRRVTIMGSYSWSKGAASNSEDMNVVTSSKVTETYAKHGQAWQAVSIRFAHASRCAGPPTPTEPPPDRFPKMHDHLVYEGSCTAADLCVEDPDCATP